ncbi:hypothetical protein RO3G_06258 [Lichtheimia corymbifera JMRC:FSU:9682]|uniref:Homeobox domain-containing protein n=1 Tax=Lichtheimia corymbifera JMRC:FSU:9682 TaxID=1263082 RepID=A0A068SJ69_9FUNG|nr:hypothetical protein RO3G_06258 [Lichtheimia corymbifera JMRC:FSU:9682]
MYPPAAAHPSFSTYEEANGIKSEVMVEPMSNMAVTIPYGDSSWPVTPVDESNAMMIHHHQPSSSLPTQQSSTHLPSPMASDLSLSYPPPDVSYHADPPSFQRPPVSLSLLLEHFPDLPRFLSHPQLPCFVRLWYQFQQDIALAKEPAFRPAVQENLQHLAVQAEGILQQIFYWQHHHQGDHPSYSDPESDTTLLLTALCRLKERVEVMQQVLQIIENGRVWFNQDPKQAVMPILQAVIKERQEQQQVHAMSVVGGSSCSGDGDGSPSPGSCCDAAAAAAVTTMPENISYIHPAALSASSDQGSTSSSPGAVEPYSTFTDMAAKEEEDTAAAAVAKKPESVDHQADQATTNDGIEDTISTLSAMDIDDDGDDTEYEQPEESDDDDEYIEPMPRRRSTRRRSGRNHDDQEMGELGQDEDNQDDNEIIQEQGTALANRRRSTTKSSSATRSYPRRTATSYDAETTHYLKSVFFSIYSKRDKLTKDQRRQVQLHTGLKPRNITYWFSNHKRRFQTSLKVFKRTVRESNGKVKTYDDFLEWRREHKLPEEVMDHELEDNNKKNQDTAAGEDGSNSSLCSPILASSPSTSCHNEEHHNDDDDDVDSKA